MRRSGKAIGCSRLRRQVKALAEILDEKAGGAESSSSESSSGSGSSSSSEDEAFYKIDKIVGVRFDANNTLLYLVRWTGYGPESDTWEPRDKLIEDGCRDRIANFHSKLGRQ